jgi:hypothetical protein
MIEVINQSFKIDEQKLKLKKQQLFKYGAYGFVFISAIVIAIYYYIFGQLEKNLLYFVLATMVVLSLTAFAVINGLKNGHRQWESYEIKVDNQGIKSVFSRPIITEFSRTRWHEEATCIEWKNLEIKLSKNIELFDKSIPYKKIRIPGEIKGKEELLEIIRSKTLTNHT